MTTTYLQQKDHSYLVKNGVLPIGEINGNGEIKTPHIQSYIPGYYSKSISQIQKVVYDDGSIAKIQFGMNDGRGNVYDYFVNEYKDDRFFVFRGGHIEDKNHIIYGLFDNNTHKFHSVCKSDYSSMSFKKIKVDYEYFDNDKNLYILNKTNTIFNGKYIQYYNGMYFDLYVSDDGKNVLFDSKGKKDNKRRWEFIIKSKELIKRYGQRFISNEFLDSIFYTNKRYCTKFFTNDDEFGGELFNVDYKSADHVNIEFVDGETIKEDDGKVLSIYIA